MIRQPDLVLIEEISLHCHTFLHDAATNAKTTNKDVLNAILKMFFVNLAVRMENFIDKLQINFTFLRALELRFYL